MPLFSVTVYKRKVLQKKNAGTVSRGPSRRFRSNYTASIVSLEGNRKLKAVFH